MLLTMENILLVIAGSLIGGVLALVGGIILLSSRRSAMSLARVATPFAAGALLAAAFFDLLPEAVELGSAKIVFTYVVVGIVAFFLLERYIHLFHHQHEGPEGGQRHTAPLVIAGDTIHNMIDGVAIGAAFLISVPVGLVTSLAVAAHEVPQEIGDFGLLLKFGYSRTRVIVINILSAFSTVPVAIITYAVGGEEAFPLSPLLGLTAGLFIYIAVADLIPRIHTSARKKLAGMETTLLILGILLVAVVSQLSHSIIEDEQPHKSPDIELQSHA